MKRGTSKNRQSTRETILHTIKSLHTATVDDLAEASGVSPVTVRHHLNALMADGKVESEAVRREIGRPHYVYSLTEDGEELFPQKYFRLSSRLLEELKRRFPPDQVSEIFNGVVQNIISEHKGEYEELSFEKKLDFLVELLSQEGFLAKWEKNGDRYELIEYSCPYQSIGESHTEVCTFDKGLIISVLNTPIEQHSCMLQGDSCCQFTIQPV